MDEFLGSVLGTVDLGAVVLLSVAVLVGIVCFIFLLSKVLCICGPQEVLVISGRQNALADGTRVGYRVLHGGRGWRIPILEELNRLDMRLIPVAVEVRNAYSKGGIALLVHAVANVRITSDPNRIRNAIERLLTQTSAEIGAIAQQTLEGALREAIAELTPEEVNQDRLKFAESLMKNAKDDFDKLGLALDVLKVQSVSDEQGYLQSIGRTQIARMLRDAQNAENASKQAIAEATAAAKQRSETAAKQAEAKVLTKRNELRAVKADLEAEAKSVENEAEIAAQTARSEAEQELQGLRAILERERLKVDVYLPAAAQREAAEAGAKAEMAPVVASGRAAAEALRHVADVWTNAGQVAQELYVLQHLQEFVSAAAARVEQCEVGELSVVDSGTGDGFGSALAMYPAAVSEVLRQTGKALGVDIASLLATNARREG